MSRLLRCPHCRAVVDGCLNPDGRIDPRDWQPTVCCTCTKVAVFDFAMPGGMRVATIDDWEAWSKDPAIVRGLRQALAAATRLREEAET